MTIIPLDIQGEPPDLVGKAIGALVCEEYWHKGKLDQPANVIHIKVDEIWYRLCFDCGMIFWAQGGFVPKPYSMDEWSSWVQLSDVGKKYGLEGQTIEECLASPIEGGSEVVLKFRNGEQIAFRNIDDTTSFVV